MPKERFHLYLAGEVLTECRQYLPSEVYRGVAWRRDLSYYIGAISPDIFFYDLPFFSMSPLGNALHDLVGRWSVSIISDWIIRTSSSTSGMTNSISEARPPASGESAVRRYPSSLSWGLGLATHFLADAIWHPTIEELSRSGSLMEAALTQPGAKQASRMLPRFPFTMKRPGRICRTETDCHRLIESEIEALRLPGSAAAQEYNELLRELVRDRGRLLEIASFYRGLIEFTGLLAEDEVPDRPRMQAGVSPYMRDDVLERRIVRCFVIQNLLLRLFANRTLGRLRNRLLSLWPFLAALVTPERPFLPESLSRVLPDECNPLSEHFFERSLAYLDLEFCEFAQRLSRRLAGEG
jgi:hypothetical protein